MELKRNMSILILVLYSRYVLGPFFFSLMVNAIKPKDPENNMLVKFADDMTVSAPVKTTGDTAFNEVKNISVG